MTIRELITKWGFQVDHAPLDKVEKQLDQIKNRLEFLAVAQVVRGIVELTERFASFAQNLQSAAMSAGITVEAFQKLSFAASQSSVDSETMSMSLGRLSRALYQARMGSVEAQMAFNYAGISANQVKNFHSSSDAMMALADRFKEIQDPILKQSLAMQLLGHNSLNMVAFLSQGSGAIRGMGDEAEKVGVILSQNQVGALVKVEHSLQELWGVMKSFSATIASYFAPSIETAIKDFLKFWEVNRKLIDTNVRAWVWDITYALGFVYEAVKTVTQKFFEFAAAHQLLVRRVSEFVIALGVLAGVLWAVQKGLSLLKGGLGLIGMALTPLQFLWTKAFMPALMLIGTLVRTLLAQLFLKLGMLIETVLPGVADAFLALGAAIEATPVGWIVTAVAALIVVLHDAWTLLTGGKWEDTWIAKAFNAVKGFAGKALSFFGVGGEEQTSASSGVRAMQNMSDLSKMNGIPHSIEGGSNSTTHYAVNAPVTFNLDAITNPKLLYQKVREGISDHLDGVNRRVQQAFTPARHY